VYRYIGTTCCKLILVSHNIDMSNLPTFTIIIPTYNQASYLGQALDSLMSQTDPDWEAVVVNDGSTDSTAEVMESYAAQDSRIRIINKQNGGTGSALNLGLREAKGKWICWLSDDLFDSHKLEILRQYIAAEPDTSFFYTHSHLLNDENHQVESPPLWREVPEREWQLLEMLRATYICRISVCVKREAMEVTGEFDERLLYGQDYDMWLRLLVHYPATFIPERTCIQRTHPRQTTHSFSEALFFDSSRAAINLLNQYKFEQLFLGVDLSDLSMARSAIERALDVATEFGSSFLYGLGPHQALLWRILEWVLRHDPDDGGGETHSLRKLVENRIRTTITEKNLDPAIRLQWKSAYVAMHLRQGDFDYVPVSPDEIAEKRYWQLRASGQGDYEALLRYLVRCGHEPDPTPEPVDSLLQTSEVVLVGQPGTKVNNPTRYGAARAWIELAHYLIRSGKQVLLIGISDKRLGMTENIMYLGLQSEENIADVLRLLAPLDSLIGISRADIFLSSTAARPLIYQHGPHIPIGEYATTLIQRLNIPVVVVSRDSMDFQLQHGIPKEQLHLVPNGYNSEVFKLDGANDRLSHRIIFAGNGVFYKGVDIAVQAFLLLRDAFHDAEFYIFGDRKTWSEETGHWWPAHWLDAEGYPLWTTIEQEVSGIKYCGEVTQEELAYAFQQSSLLIMPSRIDETFGLVSIEAQACGCIPVLPRQGGFPETMVEGVTGYLYDRNTPEDLARTISDLWAKNLPSEDQRLEAARWVRQNFSWQRTGEQIVKILGPLSMNKRHLLLLERFFWETAISCKVKLREAYRQVKSPLLRKTLKGSLMLVRRLNQ
jgi:glycosyltransferase involved in cell wall biosynthesis/GT2 family glycosyltransferase